MAVTERVEQTREYVLRYFNASPDEYTIIFTPNATGAFRLVGAVYPLRDVWWDSAGQFFRPGWSHG
jgi:selenocysteine lyase/cysteine desulfurase